MHRTLFWFRGLCSEALLLALLLAGLPDVSLAQTTRASPARHLSSRPAGPSACKCPPKNRSSASTTRAKRSSASATLSGDPTTILLTGQQSDVTRLSWRTRTAARGLRGHRPARHRKPEDAAAARPCRRPTSSRCRSRDNTVILNGTVDQSEDVDVLTRVADQPRLPGHQRHARRRRAAGAAGRGHRPGGALRPARAWPSTS